MRRSTLFTVQHHGRVYRHEMDSGELAQITASDIPAVDVCQWPQVATDGESWAVGEHDLFHPLLFCGKCNQRMAQLSNAMRRSPNPQGEATSADFAVHCHGQVYTLNLSTRELRGLEGHPDSALDPMCRLDVCDGNGKQYPHSPAQDANIKALDGMMISPSGIVFDPHKPQANGLTPAAQSSLQEICEQMIHARLHGGPITEALKNLADTLTYKVLDAIDMAKDGTDLRVSQATDNGVPRMLFIDGETYQWAPKQKKYVRLLVIKDAEQHPLAKFGLSAAEAGAALSRMAGAGMVMAKVPAPQPEAQVLPPNRGRRIVLED